MFAPAAKIPHIGTAHSRWQPSLALDSTGANCAIASSKFATGHPPEKGYVEANHISISPDLVEKSGTEMSKKIYQIWKEKYSTLNCKLMGGGVRAARHFTEMVGGDMHVTCGWNFIDEMNRTNPEILSRIDAMASPEELEELKEKIPAFRRAYEADGLVAADLSSHPAFELFHNGFLTAWDGVLSTVRERRLLLCR
jgi:hypothetical protein